MKRFEWRWCGHRFVLTCSKSIKVDMIEQYLDTELLKLHLMSMSFNTRLNLLHKFYHE